MEQVKQLTADIERNAQDSKEKAKQKQEILRAQARRYPLVEIARLIGVSRERVSMITNRTPGSAKRPHHTVRLAERTAVLEAYQAGESITDIAKRFQVTPKAVERHCVGVSDVEEKTTA